MWYTHVPSTNATGPTPPCSDSAGSRTAAWSASRIAGDCASRLLSSRLADVPGRGAELVEPRGGAAQDGLAPGRRKLVDEPAQFGAHLGVAAAELGHRPVAAEHQPARPEQ